MKQRQYDKMYGLQHLLAIDYQFSFFFMTVPEPL